MTSWAKLVPSWAWWLLALVLVAGVQQYRVTDAKGELARLKADWAVERADLAGQVATAEAAARAEEQRRQREIEGIQDEARGELERASDDARIADERADGLQREVNRLRASRSATCDAIAAQRGQAAGSAFDVLSDLLVEVERAGRAMAAEADRRGVAGKACERAYDANRSAGGQ
ncbi:DUF2514 family protein [Stutzerimonas stutzeri]|uniref:DUF2514 family protein n=1 Tax=Stutzerimonas stutzeri TaxID=316 RepID=UPI002659E382|nr:DUF2514 family protein [Stutzerimonas stutzeri]MCF6780945.1 DUF2514 domain-containing protein [Stutzerimonas stutzeri]MCF6803513.1 DUF2514 domain-containing protein [Stutzerimonas stutzeri]